ncbi:MULTISPECIES: type II toxin-antitoxin system HicB family antitoxin [Stenotrophomonas]|uniref:Type II toxin-antitoxin system HicB family antitoxin n=1 Tax=Stenotrophomonas muris TaxID=2963283 RepID=A0ABU5MMQ5_9GAMM|nr:MULTISPECIES: type II toxin-antitoxin system HicB family antitoxin [Stenotrophomonas]MBH1490994.1 type II toxin-antitoxin system HicB family antitoxin [Stenotrophomonas maltophilia]MBH1550186.1 type II toxin-antitoxin system HicB family antitoxin [Stenotrophomonas maltophilia]MBH1571266.1 type II toxin-antitoxin system HicB family antitoxin [Stenotrophomonas maltophilia]MBH1672609.1 type II toxin-antitoxin system HicB family antitoxin [Stenotrophomonas maltophilia]MBH1739265.1 type II toxin
MRYPVLIEAGDERTAWGVVVPDLPGCFSAADTLDDALTAAEEAALAWIDVALDEGRSIPTPSAPQKIAAEASKDICWILAYICVDPALLDDTIERVNISLPRRILARLDAQARAAGESRSSYIAHLAALG